jgi:hypothetical protein
MGHPVAVPLADIFFKWFILLVLELRVLPPRGDLSLASNILYQYEGWCWKNYPYSEHGLRIGTVAQETSADRRRGSAI